METPGRSSPSCWRSRERVKRDLKRIGSFPPSSDQSDIFVPRKEGDKLQKNENPGEGKAGL